MKMHTARREQSTAHDVVGKTTGIAICRKGMGMFSTQLNGICLSVLVFAFAFVLNHAAMGQEGGERKYTLAKENIQHARENLPRQIYTEDPKLTRQVHNLYIDCLFDKFWEPALPGLPYKWFSISGADDTSYGKCQLIWDTMFILNAWAPLDDNDLIHDVFR